MGKTLTAIVILLASTVLAAGSAVAEGTLSGKALAEAMGNGGYVVYMRHTKTNKNEKDSDTSDLTNCATQRNLSDEGRDQAKQAAEMLKKYGVKVSAVLASPYCRAVETAKIMFGELEQVDELRYLTRLKADEKTTANAWLTAKLAQAPAAGTVTFLISHTANLKESTGIWPKNSGDIVVFKPVGDGTFAHVGTITPDEWPGLMG